MADQSVEELIKKFEDKNQENEKKLAVYEHSLGALKPKLEDAVKKYNTIAIGDSEFEFDLSKAEDAEYIASKIKEVSEMLLVTRKKIENAIESWV